ncbi:MAG: hypothetical protein HMLKMBBP_03128 [Planctomycetes bacterium]|nr:hypothetical protein [Planctomycetota bacterium]
MGTFFTLLAEPAYAAFRMLVGAMFAMHGAQSLFDVLGNAHGVPPTGSQIWVGKIIELGCGTLVAIGLFSRYAAFLASGTMAVAFWQFHFKKAAPLPIENGGEMAVLYCFAFLVIATKGSGILALRKD